VADVIAASGEAAPEVEAMTSAPGAGTEQLLVGYVTKPATVGDVGVAGPEGKEVTEKHPAETPFVTMLTW
jgi:hypothetical protein